MGKETESPAMSAEDKRMAEAYALWCEERRKLEVERDEYKSLLVDAEDDCVAAQAECIKLRNSHSATRYKAVIIYFCSFTSLMIGLMDLDIWVTIPLLIMLAAIGVGSCVDISKGCKEASREEIVELYKELEAERQELGAE